MWIQLSQEYQQPIAVSETTLDDNLVPYVQTTIHGIESLDYSIGEGKVHKLEGHL